MPRSLSLAAFIFAAAVSIGPAGAQSLQNAERTFVVQALAQWQDTGVVVGRHPVMIRVADGRWTTDPAAGMFGPGGNPEKSGKPGYALAGSAEGMLIGRVGPYVFPVGEASSIPPGIKGRLELIINDDLQTKHGVGFTDNKGTLTVVITTFK